MREQNPSVYSDPNGIILKELYELKRLVIQQGQGQKEVISAEECAELLGVSVSYVYRLTSEKRLPHYKWLITSCRSANNIMPITFFLPAFIASSFYSA